MMKAAFQQQYSLFHTLAILHKRCARLLILDSQIQIFSWNSSRMFNFMITICNQSHSVLLLYTTESVAIQFKFKSLKNYSRQSAILHRWKRENIMWKSGKPDLFLRIYFMNLIERIVLLCMLNCWIRLFLYRNSCREPFFIGVLIDFIYLANRKMRTWIHCRRIILSFSFSPLWMQLTFYGALNMNTVQNQVFDAFK